MSRVFGANVGRSSYGKSISGDRLIFYFLSLFFLHAASTTLFLGFGRDAENYRSFYDGISSFSLAAFVWIEPGFYLSSFIVKGAGAGFDLYISLLLFIIVGAKLAIIFRNSSNIYISIFFYVSWFLLLHDATQIRLATAVVFLMFSIVVLSRGQVQYFFVFVFLAVLFHYSSFLFLGLLPLRAAAAKARSVPFFLLLVMVVSILVGLYGGIGGLLTSLVTKLIPGAYFVHKLSLYQEAAEAARLFSFKNMFVLVIISSCILFFDRMRLNQLELLSLLSVVAGFAVYALFIDFEILSVRGGEVFLFPVVFLMPAFLRVFQQKVFILFLMSLSSFLIFSYYLFYVELFGFS